MIRILILFLAGLLAFPEAWAQPDSSRKVLEVSGYVEAYYLYDLANPSNHERPDFLYSFDRHNELTVNLAYVQVASEQERVRGKLALMAGTYAQANLAAEPEALRNLFEANVGVKLAKERYLWLDAGVFASHIGFESAIGANCWNMTRSILAENSPYYLAGAKITYQNPAKTWLVSGLVVNGWQRIGRVPGNQTPGIGHQLTWTPNERVLLNSSSFIGSDSPNGRQQMRYFHNLYGVFQLTPELGLIAGLDVGVQQQAAGSREVHTWFSPVAIARVTLSDRMTLAMRGEYYADPGGVIIPTASGSEFQVAGYSCNFDLQVWENVLWRVEVRGLSSLEEPQFVDSNQQPGRHSFSMGTSLSILL